MEYTNKILEKKLKSTWGNIKQRCMNPNNPRFYYYSKVGVSAEWLVYGNFKKDMYSELVKHIIQNGIHNTTIDRINNSFGYSKENCRWATWQKQSENSINCPLPMLQFNCNTCNKEILSKRNRKFCSYSCKGTYVNKVTGTSSRKRKQIKFNIMYNTNNEFRKRIRERQRKYYLRLKERNCG